MMELARPLPVDAETGGWRTLETFSRNSAYEEQVPDVSLQLSLHRREYAHSLHTNF